VRAARFVIIVAVAAAKERNVKLLTELGATHVVDQHAENVEERVRAVNGGEVRLLSGRVKGMLVGLLPGTADEKCVRGKGKGLRINSRLGRGVCIGSQECRFGSIFLVGLMREA
jgi:hypothetical protein